MAQSFRIRNQSVGTIKRKYLLPDPLNWHVHGDAQRTALSAIFNEVGFVGHLLVRPAATQAGYFYIVDGHERADHFGPDDDVPCCVLEVDEDEARKLLAAYDPLGYVSGVDQKLAAELLEHVIFEDASLKDAIEQSLKRIGEVDAMIAAAATPAVIVEDDPQIDRAAELQQKWSTETGQLWQITGPNGTVHRLLCGDSTKAEDVKRVMGGDKADAVISDPPWGINMDTDYRRMTTGFGVPRKQHEPVVGDDIPFDPTPWLNYKHVVLWGANHFAERIPRGTWLVWDKRFKGGQAILSDGELAWMKGGYGVYIKSVVSQGFIRPEKIEHPTQKPVAVMVWSIEKSKSTGLILDPFLGSGTTLVACENLGRAGFGIEIDAGYCAVILERMTDLGCRCELLDAPITVPTTSEV